MTPEILMQQQDEVLRLYRQGLSYREIATQMGLSKSAVFRRVASAKKAEKLDPEFRHRLAKRGVTDLAGLHSGWLIEKDSKGAGQSLYFHLGGDQDPIEFAQAVRDSLEEVPRAPLIPAPRSQREAKDNATWLFLADLHVGGDYGAPYLEEDFKHCIDSIISRLPAAEKAVLVELGDLLDANDHKGVTPASGNPCDVVRDDHLGNTRQAIRLMKYAIDRLAESHPEVEVHLIPGNHDPDAYIAVLLTLEAHYEDNKRIEVIVPQNPDDEEFRIIEWGNCSCLPHHGHRAKWAQLKDVYTEIFADEWARTKMFRLIATAHYHHEKSADLIGATGRQFRTIHRPNKWAKGLGLLSRGTLTALTVNREDGQTDETMKSLKPFFLPKES